MPMMSMYLLLAAVFQAMSVMPSAREARAQPPHLILITADQLRFDALRCNGSRVAQTPNIDRLAARGVSFRYAYTPAPLCMPARVILVTVRWPHQHGICCNERPPIRPDQ